MFQLHLFHISTQIAFSQCCISVVSQQWFTSTAGKMKQWNNAGFYAYVHYVLYIPYVHLRFCHVHESLEN